MRNEDIYDSNNHIKVFWEDTLDNHSQVKEKQIEKYFQNKYKTTKVKVIFKPIISKNSELVAEGGADASELILDENYQKKLMEQYLTDNNIEINPAHLIKLDGSVNIELENYKEQTNRYKKFKIKEIEVSNFLSYGSGNKIKYENKNGITSVISEPANYGGKTTMTVDLLLFLFFGTTTKTDKNEEVFNRFLDSDLVEVKGKVEIEGDDYIIKRTITRKKSKDGSYTCKGEVDFYQVLPRGGIKQLNGEQRKYTDELIKTYVGTYDDFLITILTTGDNLDDLIKTKPTERGRILTRFIGLEFFREKEKIAKKKYTDWKEKSKLYHNNSQEILAKITVEEDYIKQYEQMLVGFNTKLVEVKGKINELTDESEKLYKQRYNDIDTELYKSNEENIVTGIQKLEDLIKDKENSIRDLVESMPEPKNDYDIDLYGTLKGELRDYTEREIKTSVEIQTIESTIYMLKNSEICQTCKRPLDDVDHSSEIEKNELLLEGKKENLETYQEIIKIANSKITDLDKVKISWDDYNRNNLLVEKSNLELKAYQDSLIRGNDKLKRYRDIKEKVEKNQIIDTDIQKIKFSLNSLNDEKETVSLQINGTERDIVTSKGKIDGYNALLKELKNEEIIDHIFKVYLDIYGKNGISKMVLSTMIPLINSHLKILLADSCEFVLEMRMNDKGEVEFWMVDNETDVEKPLNAGSGYEKTVSSLALRCVLSKVCSLPKPNIIVFDEVTGKVSNQNLEKVGLFFEKLKQFFEHIWVISHNPLIQDWADHRVLVKKENNISTVIDTI
jgi:DNA repair exonuclease SbcCD ATPase subunit